MEVTHPQAGELPAEGKNWWHRVLEWEHLGLCLIIVATLVMHFVVISRPAEPVFDEQHYVPDARAIISGQGTLRPEHPPLGKLFIVSGMLAFGDNPFGWRFFSVIMGAFIIVFFYFICRELGLSRRGTYIATLLLALDNLSFVQAGVALLDVYTVVFMMAGFLFYLKRGYLLSGISIGLSALAKMTGALAFIPILLHWFIQRRDKPFWFLASVVLAPLSYIIFMPPLDYFAFSGKWLDPISRTQEMLSLMGSLTFATVSHDAASRPWDWLLSPNMVPYWWEPHYVAITSYSIWALIIPAVIYMLYRASRGSNAAWFGLCWFAGTYLIWIPLTLITDRISFAYYFYPTVGAVCLGLGLGLSQALEIARRRTGHKRHAIQAGVVTYLALHVAAFVVLTPVFPLVKMP